MGPPGADQHLAGSLRAAGRNLTGRGCSFVHRADPGCPSDDAQKRRSHPVRRLGLGDCADDSAVREPGDPDCHGCTFNARGDPAAAEIQDAYRLIAPLIGVPIASFCSRAAWRRPELGRDRRDARWPGRHGGLSRAESPPSWLRRLVTRLLAIIPSIIIASFYCHRGVGKLLIASQIMLSLQLPFADLPTRDGSTSSHGSWPK